MGLDWLAKGLEPFTSAHSKKSAKEAVATAGERMPHKSTYFFPKPLTGLVVNVME